MNKEKNEFEELLLENEKLEPIERRKNHSIKIPTISVYKLTFGFNEAAAKIVPDYIKWYKTREYIIGLPSTEFDSNSYPVRKDMKRCWVVTTFPVALRSEKTIKKGTYKLLKYKNGFAFKTNEPLKKEKK